jgi:drug/metabolite transporter (DMT)-like permease
LGGLAAPGAAGLPQPSLPRLWKTIGHMVILSTTNGWLTNVLTATAVSHVDGAVVVMLQAAVPLIAAVLVRERRAWVRS